MRHGGLLLGFVAWMVLFVLWLRTSRRVAAQERRLARLLGPGKPENLEQRLAELEAIAMKGEQAQTQWAETMQELTAIAGNSFRRFAIRRYNAFSDVGAQLSFSMAILTGGGDGIVLTGLYGREEMRVYAKEVADGRSIQALSHEEEDVLRRAIGS